MNLPGRLEYPRRDEISDSPRRKISAHEVRGHGVAIPAGFMLLLSRALLLVACWIATPTLAQLLDRDTSDQHVYDGAKTIIDSPLAEVLKAVPELRGLEPAQDQEKLPEVLGKVGANVEVLLEGFPNLVSRENIAQETVRVNRSGSVQTHRLGPFSYMILAHKSSGRVDLEEYRTDAKGNRSEPQQSEPEFSLTKGFATLWTLFNPGNRSSAWFKLLGQQELDGRKTSVVAFAQRPGWATVTGKTLANGRSVLILYQGIAWIDMPGYHIVRMRTDLLAPRWDVGLRRQTTEVEFGEVRLPEVANPLWLPCEIVVTAELNGEVFRNQHHYTNYRLFRVESTIKPIEPSQPIPKN